MSHSLRREPSDGIGRKNRSVVFAFALSLLLHGSVIFLLARNASKDYTLTLGLSLQPASIEARLIPAQTRQTAVVKSQAELAQPVEKTPAPRARRVERASKPVASSSSTIPKLVDLKTGTQLDLSQWQGVKVQGRPIKIRLTISPAGLIQSWELLTPDAGPLQLDREAMNIMVRNMDANKTGETHVLIWESQVGKKNGELIAKIYASTDD